MNEQTLSDVKAVIEALRTELQNHTGLPHQKAAEQSMERFLISTALEDYHVD